MRMRIFGLGLWSAVVFSIATAQIAQQLQNGGDFVFKFNGADYTITGAANFSESFNPRPATRLTFADLNNDGIALDILLDLQTLAGIDRQVALFAEVLSDDGNTAIVRWSGTDNPNICVEVSDDGFTANVQIFEVSGVLTGRVQRVGCGADPYGVLGRNAHLEILKEGGDAINNLRMRAYLFCIENPYTVITVDVFNIRWAGSGGGLPLSVGNMNGDCTVDDADLLQVLFNFGSSDPASDANGDGTVDDADLLTVLFNFGQGV